MTSPLVETWATAAAALVLLGAAVGDLRTRLVPNWVPALLGCVGLALHLARGDLRWSLLAAALVFAVTLGLWSLRLMGGADAKLIPAVTTLLPASHTLELLLFITLCGGVLSTAYLVLRCLPPLPARRRRPRLLRYLRLEQRRTREANALPYVVAVCAGTLIALAKG